MNRPPTMGQIMGVVFGQKRTDLIKLTVTERSKSRVFVQLTSAQLNEKLALSS